MKPHHQRLIFVIIPVLLFMACEQAPPDIFTRHFMIPAGKHYATPRLAEMLQSEKLSFTAKFDESAIYNFNDAGMQSNKNKLLGFSDCNSLHHENSARFAWQWFNGHLEIYAYCYVNSVRVEEFIGVVNLNEENHYQIILTDNEYVFYLNGENKVHIKRGNACDKGLYYLLYPYFGGSLPAPHNVKIDLSIIK